MAKRNTANGMNKSEEIRDYLKSNPTATPKTIQAALLEKGIEVSAGLISVVKYGGNKGKGKGRKAGRRGRRVMTPAGTSRRDTTESFSAGDLIAAKKLVDQLGGVSQVRGALRVLEQIA